MKKVLEILVERNELADTPTVYVARIGGGGKYRSQDFKEFQEWVHNWLESQDW